ncbi:MAG: hypothetical protein AAFN11_05680 [Chloroflexota bacterium]
MGDFLIQFITQAWRLFAIIGVLIVIGIFAWRREQANKQKKLQERRDMQDAIISNQKPRQQKKARRAPAPADDLEFEPLASSAGSIFDDDEIFADDDLPPPQPEAENQDSIFENEDIFAENDPVAPAQPPSVPPVAEEPVASFADLLNEKSVEPAQASKDYHQLATTPVVIQLDTKDLTLAKEVLSISRDERDKRLMVQIGDKAYRTLLDTPEVRKVFTKTMKALSADVLKPDTVDEIDVDITGASFHVVSKEPIDLPVSSGWDTTALEMLSIMIDEKDGHYLVQIGKTGYRSLAENERAKKVFAKIMKELSTVVLTEDDNPPVAASSEPEPAAVDPSTFAMAFDEEEEIPGDLRYAKMDEMPDGYEVGRFGQIKVKKVENKVEDLDIAGAIEAYLQYKIKHAPEFQKRGIHIRSSYGGGVRIDIEGRTYESVDDVEPLEARAFIKQAIAEWQERH